MRREMRTCSFHAAFIASFLLIPRAAIAQAPAAERPDPKFIARVIDSKTLEPIPKFLALAGVNPMDDIGWQWQSHTIREFKDGELQWPPEGFKGYDDQMLRIEAPGYIPAHERFTKAEPPAVEPVIVRLTRDPGVAGRVLAPEGKPIDGAIVALGMANDRTIRIESGEIVVRPLGENASLRERWSRPIVVHSDAEGRFELPTEIVEQTIVAATHASGVAMMAYPDFVKSGELRLEPWGKVVARVAWGDEADNGFQYSLSTSGRVSQLHLVGSMRAQEATDPDGGLIFLDVPPGHATLARGTKPAGEQQISVLMPHQRLEVKPGEVTHVIFGGSGQTVSGKLVGRDDWIGVFIHLALPAPHVGFPGDNEIWQAYHAFLESPAGQRYSRTRIPVGEDGSFEIKDMPPEQYQMRVTIEHGEAGTLLSTYVHIESIVNGVDQPKDLGEIQVR